jgi:regulator of sigma D
MHFLFETFKEKNFTNLLYKDESMSTGISFYPNLVQEMTDDHRELLALYGELVRAVNAQDGTVFKSVLIQFKSQLVAHLLKEAVKLYIYLRQKLKADESTYHLVSSYKSEMDGISRTAMNFVDEYTSKTVDQLDYSRLSSQLRDIGVVLGDRIRREEHELYPLYHDHY